MDAKISNADCTQIAGSGRRVPACTECASRGFFHIFPLIFLRKGPFARTSHHDNVRGMMLASDCTRRLFKAAGKIINGGFLVSCAGMGIINIIGDNDFLAPSSCTRICLPCDYHSNCSSRKDR